MEYKRQGIKAGAFKDIMPPGAVLSMLPELPDGMPGTSYMPICLAMVDVADAVYALDNWTES